MIQFNVMFRTGDKRKRREKSVGIGKSSQTLSDQGTTRNGTDTCLILIIVQEWIQPRFRGGVVTAGHSSLLPTLLSSELVVETVEIATRSKGSISLNSPLMSGL